MRPADLAAIALAAAMAIMAVGGAAGGATATALYHAGLRALADGDCQAARRNFDEFFLQNPGYVSPRPHPFYFDVLRAIDACQGKLSISGIGQDSGQPPPLPGEPPTVE